MSYRWLFTQWGDSAPTWRFPAAVRDQIERAAVEAQRESGITARGPVEQQRVQDFLAEVECCVALDEATRQKRLHLRPTKAELEPLRDIADALDTIDKALRKLGRVRGMNGSRNTASVIELGFQVNCYRALRAAQFERDSEIAQLGYPLIHDILNRYLPKGKSSLQWMLAALRTTVVPEIERMKAIPPNRPTGNLNRNLATDVAQIYVNELNCPLLVGESTGGHFLRILRLIFDSRQLAGKMGEPITDKTLAEYIRSAAARLRPFSAD
jgi:hypothetical protein